MVEEIKEKVKRPLTDEEKKDIQKSIDDSSIKLPIMEWKLEHAKLMISKGLEMNYNEAKLKLANDIKELERAISFEKKVIEQYKDIMANGICDADLSDQE